MESFAFSDGAAVDVARRECLCPSNRVGITVSNPLSWTMKLRSSDFSTDVNDGSNDRMRESMETIDSDAASGFHRDMADCAICPNLPKRE